MTASKTQQHFESLVENEELIGAASFRLGFLIGTLIELSVLGVGFLVDSIISRSDQSTATAVCLYVWPICSYVFAVASIALLRSFVRALCGHKDHYSCTSVGTESSKDSDNGLEELLVFVENRFSAGGLVGLSATWAGADWLMGIPLQVHHSFLMLLLFVACLCLQASKVLKIDSSSDHSFQV